MKLCVIGAGPTGMAAVKHGIDFGCDVTVFEQTDKVGGLWNFTDDIGQDKHGLDIHANIYHGLHTNAPKEGMGYPCFPFPTEKEESYIPWQDILGYFQKFAEKFDLYKCIKFNHHVIRVRPLRDNKWEVIVKDLQLGLDIKYQFHAVLVCNGHFSVPIIPELKGIKEFQGQVLHSRDYKRAENFKGKNVLVIGGRTSGVDITYEISEFAEKVTWSHHNAKPLRTAFGPNVDIKPDVCKVTSTGVLFDDGSYEDYSAIVYCTGYKYSLPFLSVDCGIVNHGNRLKPLYKHCLNINHPTMGFVGVANIALHIPLFDIQARFCLAFITGRKKMPTRQEMLEDLARDRAERKAKGMGKHMAHHIDKELYRTYVDELADTAGVEPLKPVMSSMFVKSITNMHADTANFRKINFKIIDDETFVTSGTL